MSEEARQLRIAQIKAGIAQKSEALLSTATAKPAKAAAGKTNGKAAATATKATTSKPAATSKASASAAAAATPPATKKTKTEVGSKRKPAEEAAAPEEPAAAVATAAAAETQEQRDAFVESFLTETVSTDELYANRLVVGGLASAIVDDTDALFSKCIDEICCSSATWEGYTEQADELKADEFKTQLKALFTEGKMAEACTFLALKSPLVQRLGALQHAPENVAFMESLVVPHKGDIRATALKMLTVECLPAMLATMYSAMKQMSDEKTELETKVEQLQKQLDETAAAAKPKPPTKPAAAAVAAAPVKPAAPVAEAKYPVADVKAPAKTGAVAAAPKAATAKPVAATAPAAAPKAAAEKVDPPVAAAVTKQPQPSAAAETVAAAAASPPPAAATAESDAVMEDPDATEAPCV